MTAAHPLPTTAPSEERAWRPRIVPRTTGPGAVGPPDGMWFTETHHAGALIPAVSLAAHLGGGVRPGALLPPQGHRGTRVGAIRWQLRSGLVETLDVAPPFMGRGADRVLAAAARALAALRGWPVLDGDLTERPLTVRHLGVERLMADRVPVLI